MPRFVILEHDYPQLHWDFMLEAGAVLRTWRLASPPAVQETIAAERIADHRQMYLDYEGPVSGGRGTVKRWDGGTFDWLDDTDERIILRLQGSRIAGTLRLERTAGTWRGCLS